MKLLSMKIWFALLAALLPFSAMPAEKYPAAPVISPEQWMRAMADDLLVPGYTQLAAQARQLDRAVQALCQTRSATTLTQAQTQWRVVASRWRRLEALPIGPTLERRSLRRFDFWPTRPAQIEEAIAKAPRDAAAFADIGVSAQGLPALEYLLFENPSKLAAEPARCRYGASLARAFADETAALAPAWKTWRERWSKGDIDPKVSKAALTDAFNATLGALEQLRLRKLEKPTQPRGKREPLFDAWRSGATRAHLLATFDGVRIVLTGGASDVGLSSVVRGMGLHPIAVRMENDVRTVAAALQSLPATPSQDLAAIKRATADIARLQETLSSDVAKALNVMIGFNESDGD